MTSTYMRDAMPQGMRATCPLCLRDIEVNASGCMVRHGWKEQGRQAGQYGLGRQWGDCIATGLMPLEQTDQDGLRMITRLHEARDHWLDAAGKHADAVHESYTRRLDLSVHEWGEAVTDSYHHKIENAYLAAGLDFETRAYDKRPAYSHMGREPIAREERAFSIPRGFEGVNSSNSWERERERVLVPSYDKLRKDAEQDCRHQAAALQEAANAIREAVKAHAATEPVRKVARKTQTMHQACRPYRSMGKSISVSCGSTSLGSTEDKSKVTCSRCLKAIAKRDVEDARKAAVAALAERIYAYLGKRPGGFTVTEIMKALGIKKRKTANEALEHLKRAERARERYDSTPTAWAARVSK